MGILDNMYMEHMDEVIRVLNECASIDMNHELHDAHVAEFVFKDTSLPVDTDFEEYLDDIPF